MSEDMAALVERARRAADDLAALAEGLARDYTPRRSGTADGVVDLVRSRWWSSGLWNPPRREAAHDALEFARHAQAEVASIATWPAVQASAQAVEADPAVVERLTALIVECERAAARLER